MRTVVLVFLIVVVLITGCTILSGESQDIQVRNNSTSSSIPVGNLSSQGTGIGNETGETVGWDWSGGLLTEEEISLLYQRHAGYIAHPEEIPILGESTGHPDWILTDKMTIIRTVLSDDEARAVIDDQGAVIGVALSIHPTPKDSGQMGGPALRVYRRGVVTDYIVDESTLRVVEKVIGPVEVIPEIRDNQLNLG
ncbi:MAG: hypothetical protein LUQ01_00465 [Methanolinea sp.]|nr:hypothetical protein [Methanolinea sp.]